MQQEVFDHIDAMLDAMDGDKPPQRPPEDFGFNKNHQWVIESAQMLLDYKILPYAGGWADQDYYWRCDFFTFMAQLAWRKWQRDNPDEGVPGADPEDKNELWLKKIRK